MTVNPRPAFKPNRHLKRHKVNSGDWTMIRTAILGFAAAAALATAAFAPSAASVGQSIYVHSNKPHYVKGRIQKDCLENHGDCTLIVR